MPAEKECCEQFAMGTFEDKTGYWRFCDIQEIAIQKTLEAIGEVKIASGPHLSGPSFAV